MSEPFIGLIQQFAFNYAPQGWAQCNGQLLPINQNQALFAILGTTYGGNGVTTFALPDLRGRVPVHPGDGIMLGTIAGEETHTLTINEMPQHTHSVSGSKDGTSAQPTNQLWGKGVQSENSSYNIYAQSNTPGSHMNHSAISVVGSSQAHNNMQPYAVGNYCIAIYGIFPSRN